jgi:hypothetical protein
MAPRARGLSRQQERIHPHAYLRLSLSGLSPGSRDLAQRLKARADYLPFLRERFFGADGRSPCTSYHQQPGHTRRVRHADVRYGRLRLGRLRLP